MSQAANANFLSKYKNPASSTSWNNNNNYNTNNNYSTFDSSNMYQNNIHYAPSEGLAHEVLNVAGPPQVYHRSNAFNQLTNGHIPTNNQGVPQRINTDHDPIRLSRPIEPVRAKQNIRVRYLQPPEPPAQAPIIVKERQLTPPPPAPPLVIRQISKPPPTPPPLIIRERPPTPPKIATQPTVIEKVLPPPTPPPRQVIVERIPAPEKPRDVIYEKWLPYKPPGERPVLVERGRTYERQPPPKNVIIEYEHPTVNLERQIFDEGVLRADPANYNRVGYNGELRIVDKITDLPTANSAFAAQTYQPMWSNASSSYATPRDYPSPMSTARGPTQYMGPWNTTYRSSYTGRGYGSSPRM